MNSVSHQFPTHNHRNGVVAMMDGKLSPSPEPAIMVPVPPAMLFDSHISHRAMALYLNVAAGLKMDHAMAARLQCSGTDMMADLTTLHRRGYVVVEAWMPKGAGHGR